MNNLKVIVWADQVVSLSFFCKAFYSHEEAVASMSIIRLYFVCGMVVGIVRSISALSLSLTFSLVGVFV